MENAGRMLLTGASGRRPVQDSFLIRPVYLKAFLHGLPFRLGDLHTLLVKGFQYFKYACDALLVSSLIGK